MANQNVNKVVYFGETLIDLTEDTVTAADVINSKKFHDKSGAIVTGTCTFNVNASDANADASEILATKTAYVGSSKVTGSMPNIGKHTGTISTVAGKATIPAGYHDGSGSVSIDSTEQSKIIATNIREGVTILGVTGTMSGSEAEKPQANKDVTPSKEQQIITPDSEFTCLSQVTVKPVPYSEADNAQGGKTVTIG